MIADIARDRKGKTLPRMNTDNTDYTDSTEKLISKGEAGHSQARAEPAARSALSGWLKEGTWGGLERSDRNKDNLFQ